MGLNQKNFVLVPYFSLLPVLSITSPALFPGELSSPQPQVCTHDPLTLGFLQDFWYVYIFLFHCQTCCLRQFWDLESHQESSLNSRPASISLATNYRALTDFLIIRNNSFAQAAEGNLHKVTVLCVRSRHLIEPN